MATSASQRAGGTFSNLLLKVTPARVPRDLLIRQRLAASVANLHDCTATVVAAPAGFGKTALLAQWRREFLARGTVVAWVSAQEEDDPQRFVQGLALAVRVGSGRSTFGHTLLEGVVPARLEGITAWLAEVAQSALDVVLFVDEAERLPEASRDALSYLIHNAPANLRILVAVRPDPEYDLGVADMIPYGQCAVVGVAMLRFSLDETLALVKSRLGSRIDADTAARLHELTEGWPLGLQLALSTVARSPDPRASIDAMSTRSGELHHHFVSTLLANLEPDDAEFLTRISIVDDLHADLCRAMTDMPDAAERLSRLARETPLLVAGEDSEWMRMHAVAREAMRERFERLPADARSGLQARASDWLANHGLLEQAAWLAFASGRHELAFDLAERCLYENFLTRGHVGAVLDWLARLPAEELDRRPRLLLAAAWALAVGERHAEAEAQVARILAHADGDTALRCECALILSGAAGFADEPDRFAELHAPWDVSPPLTNPLLLYVHANRKAFRALLSGDPAQGRHHQQQAPRGEFGNAFRYVARWGEFVTGLSYVWEGQVRLAESLLRPALAGAEAELGRRHPLVCMLAALLAAAVWELDQPDEASALLANRLDVLERSGLPDAVLLGFRTAARIAVTEGTEHRALALLEGLHAVGLNRRLPRLCLASLVDQARMHARRFRPETCRDLCERIDALMASDGVPTGRLWRLNAEWMQHLAHAYAAIAAQDWRRALEPLTRAAAGADALNLGRVRIEVMALRAFVLDRLGERSVGLLKEAIDLAQTYGLERLFVDAHPALGDWAQRVGAGPDRARPPGGADGQPALAAALQPPRAVRPGPRVTPSLALTPKEREVLEFLARKLTNKEIALAMQIGEETIKWHLKNLFGKLDAGTRRQVVQRAQLLGLLESAD